MNYTLNSIKINSNWFDDKARKQSTYDKIGYKGLNLYFQLYKFRLHRQENEHTFMTSISMLRKETGYKTDEVFELLKKLKSAKVINIENVSKWSYLIDSSTKKVKDKDILHITALDTFPIENYQQQDDRYYIYIPLDLFEEYKRKGLNEKYYALYCLIKKWSQNTEGKMYMAIEKIAGVLGFDKDYINKMINNMNKNYLLSSRRRKRESGFGYKFEHYLLDSMTKEKVEKFLEAHKSNMDRYADNINEIETEAPAEVAFTESDNNEICSEKLHNLSFEEIVNMSNSNDDEYTIKEIVDSLPF